MSLRRWQSQRLVQQHWPYAREKWGQVHPGYQCRGLREDVVRELWDRVLTDATLYALYGGEGLRARHLLQQCCRFRRWGGRAALYLFQERDAWANPLACGKCGKEGHHG